MRRIVVAVAVHVFALAVVAHLAFRLAVVRKSEAQIVAVAALAVDDLAEDALADHVQHHQLVTAVVAVFQQHRGNMRLLIGVHEAPAVVDGVRAADLGGGVFAGLHAVDGDLDMVGPRRRDDDALDFVDVQEVVVVRQAARFIARVFPHAVDGAPDAVLVLVADGDDFDVLHRGDETCQTEAASAETDDADFRFFHRM